MTPSQKTPRTSPEPGPSSSKQRTRGENITMKIDKLLSNAQYLILLSETERLGSNLYLNLAICRLRRELSEKGKECFMKGQYDQVLQYYNKALMYR